MDNHPKNPQALVCPELAAFAYAMESCLKRKGYDDPEAWIGIPISKMLSMLEDKAKRLAASDPHNPVELFRKAEVLGNLAMMIAAKATAEHMKTHPEVRSMVDMVPEPPTRTKSGTMLRNTAVPRGKTSTG